MFKSPTRHHVFIELYTTMRLYVHVEINTNVFFWAESCYKTYVKVNGFKGQTDEETIRFHRRRDFGNRS